MNTNGHELPDRVDGIALGYFVLPRGGVGVFQWQQSIMRKPSQSKGVSAKKSVTIVRNPARRVSAGSARSVKSSPKAGSKALAPGGRVLVSGRTRAELRRLGEAVAAEANQSLYRVDLSLVASRYIGETEKNLDRVFAFAESTGAILFFDEADALFGKRTEVRDSHDRYANQEVSYLLERIESHPGLVILSTNRRENLDEATLRRLRFIKTVRRPVRRKSG